MISIKLKYKIDILYKLIKNNPKEFSLSQTTNHKHPLKMSISNNYESIAVSEREYQILSPDEKDATLNLMKTINHNTLSMIFQIINKKNFYKIIKSKIGLELIRNSIKEILTRNNYSNIENDNSFDNLLIYDECEFYFILKEILNVNELEAMDLFDLFKYNEYFSITQNNFFIIIYLLIAYEDGEFTDFVLTFNDDFFNIVSGDEEYISVSKLYEIAIIIGIQLSKNILTKKNLEITSLINKEKFKEINLELAFSHDEVIKSECDYINSIAQPKINKKIVQDKDRKLKDVGCVNKSCKIKYLI